MRSPVLVIHVIGSPLITLGVHFAPVTYKIDLFAIISKLAWIISFLMTYGWRSLQLNTLSLDMENIRLRVLLLLLGE